MDFSSPDPEIFFNLLKERGKVEKKWKIVVNQFHFFPFFKRIENLITLFSNSFKKIMKIVH